MAVTCRGPRGSEGPCQALGERGGQGEGSGSADKPALPLRAQSSDQGKAGDLLKWGGRGEGSISCPKAA